MHGTEEERGESKRTSSVSHSICRLLDLSERSCRAALRPLAESVSVCARACGG